MGKKRRVAEEFRGVWIKTDEIPQKFTGREQKEQKERYLWIMPLRRLTRHWSPHTLGAQARSRQFTVEAPHIKSKREAGRPIGSKYSNECRFYVPTNREAVWLFNAFATIGVIERRYFCHIPCGPILRKHVIGDQLSLRLQRFHIREQSRIPLQLMFCAAIRDNALKPLANDFCLTLFTDVRW